MQEYNLLEPAVLRISPANQTDRAQPCQTAALVTLCAAVLIAQIDTSVVNLAVRPIGHAAGTAALLTPGIHRAVHYEIVSFSALACVSPGQRTYSLPVSDRWRLRSPARSGTLRSWRSSRGFRSEP